ncbi:MAG: 30S ribosomal protein S19 [Candidatus Marinimicrobia bacterium]|nr:30S ribosomal protein S19 [Candidatus Neomarinimicrobiota bacterium]
MSRSIRKGPHIDIKLLKKVDKMNESPKKGVIKTWARNSVIVPDFVGHTFAVHNGNKFIPIFITENMVGHKLGEFSPTRIFRRHAGDRK